MLASDLLNCVRQISFDVCTFFTIACSSETQLKPTSFFSTNSIMKWLKRLNTSNSILISLECMFLPLLNQKFKMQ